MQMPFCAIMRSWTLLAAFGGSYAPDNISYVRHFWSRGPRATRKRKPAHLKFKGHMPACCIYVAGHHYTYRASTHVQQLSDNQQRRLEAETTHEREERLQQLSAAQVRS